MRNIESASTPMPVYRSHKKVWALKIERVEYNGTDTTTDENPIVTVHFEDKVFLPQVFNLRNKPMPEAGWYFIQYEDGYTSFSPAKQFEEGYTPVTSAGKQLTFEIGNVAQICHEANASYCRTLGDNSQLSWQDAPQWQKESAVRGVNFHIDSLLSGIEPSPSDSHNSWLKQKREEGWKYGPVKNPETKEHPCFVPYDQLPQDQRLKDYIFGAIVKAFLDCKA